MSANFAYVWAHKCSGGEYSNVDKTESNKIQHAQQGKKIVTGVDRINTYI